MTKARKKKTARKRKPAVPAKSSWGGRLWRLFLLLCGISLGVLVPWTAYLNHQVTTEFEGRKWDLPSRVYARPLAVYPGALMTMDDLLLELSVAGYREATRVSQPGQYSRKGSTVEIHGT